MFLFKVMVGDKLVGWIQKVSDGYVACIAGSAGKIRENELEDTKDTLVWLAEQYSKVLGEEISIFSCNSFKGALGVEP